MIKDTNFYNKESGIYSEKRYPEVPTNYVQFFFKERLRLVIGELEKYVRGKVNLSLLEIGCADGVVVEKIHAVYGKNFTELAGIDIAPEMVRVARERYAKTGILFENRRDYKDERRKDMLIEVGVINYASLDAELEYVSSHLKEDGVAIISLGGRGSLWDKRRKTDTGFANFLSYPEYEKIVGEKFEIIRSIPVGLPIPLVWKMPVLGRITEACAEKIFRPLHPNFFHEKIYVLKAGSKNLE